MDLPRAGVHPSMCVAQLIEIALRQECSRNTHLSEIHISISVLISSLHILFEFIVSVTCFSIQEAKRLQIFHLQSYKPCFQTAAQVAPSPIRASSRELRAIALHAQRGGGNDGSGSALLLDLVRIYLNCASCALYLTLKINNFKSNQIKSNQMSW